MRTTYPLLGIQCCWAAIFALFVNISLSSAALMFEGDPVDGGSWYQTFNESKVGKFDLLAVQLVSSGPLEAKVFRNFTVGGWTDQPTGYSPPSDRALGIATGPATKMMTFEIWFAGTAATTSVKFNYFGYHGDTLVDSALASRPAGGSWSFSSVTTPIPTAAELRASIVPEPGSLIVWSLLGSCFLAAGFHHRRKAASDLASAVGRNRASP